jgi:hypothetical protein
LPAENRIASTLSHQIDTGDPVALTVGQRIDARVAAALDIHP